MSTSTPQSYLTSAIADLTGLQVQLTEASTSIVNAEKVMVNSGGKTSLKNAVNYIGGTGGAQSLATSTLASVQNALALIVPTPGPTPPSNPQPHGPGGAWTNTFFDDFLGSTINTTQWDTHDGWTRQNGVTDHAANVSVANSILDLALVSTTSGAAVESKVATLPVGGFAEARIDFAGNGTSVDDWPAWWVSGPNWPAAGESDIAEGLGTLTVNYHSPQGANNTGTVPGVWVNGFHTFGIHRLSDHCDVYYDGQLDRTYQTHDNGQPENLILTIGYAGGAFTPVNLKIDYVGVWI